VRFDREGGEREGPFVWKIPKTAKYLAIFIAKSWFLWKICMTFGISMRKYTKHSAFYLKVFPI